METACRIIVEILVAVGGTGVVFWKFSSYFGKLWADKHIESIKKEHQKEIASFKTQLELQKVTSMRYSEKQFELYNDIWISLCKLKNASDFLWEELTTKNMMSFTEQLATTSIEAEKSYLLIEDEHYKILMKLLTKLAKYRMGKKELLTKRNRVAHGYDEITAYDIKKLISDNEKTKKEYDSIIKEIGKELKMQIRGVI